LALLLEDSFLALLLDVIVTYSAFVRQG
jgi:hypothetical protein